MNQRVATMSSDPHFIHPEFLSRVATLILNSDDHVAAINETARETAHMTFKLLDSTAYGEIDYDLLHKATTAIPYVIIFMAALYILLAKGDLNDECYNRLKEFEEEIGRE